MMTSPLRLPSARVPKAPLFTRRSLAIGLRRRLASPLAGTPRGVAKPARRLVELLLPSAAEEALTRHVLAQCA